MARGADQSSFLGDRDAEMLQTVVCINCVDACLELTCIFSIREMQELKASRVRCELTQRRWTYFPAVKVSAPFLDTW